MIGRKKLIGAILLLIFLLVMPASVYSAVFSDLDINSQTLTSEALMAYNKVINNQSQLRDLNERGIGTTRISDEIFLAAQLFENAYIKQKEGVFGDYSKSLAQSNQTADLIQRAFGMKDELVTLKEEIDLQTEQLDVTGAKELYSKAEQEFTDQRFERVLEYIDAAYTKLSELQSVQAKSTAMFAASQKNFEEFVKQNWAILAIVIGVPVILYLLFRKKITIYILKKKIELNEMEIIVLKDELKTTQSNYFVKGNMAEATYHIRVRLYGDKIRDLNKENALYTEKIAELGHKPEPREKIFAAPEIKKTKRKKA
jgi:hypothetical protein